MINQKSKNKPSLRHSFNSGALKGLLISLLLFTLLFVPERASADCSILVYHHFSSDTPASTSVTPNQFKAHLQYLKDNDFQVIPLAELVAKMDEGILPEKCVSLSADDAYLSIYKNAYPILQEFNMHLAVFVATDPIDKGYRAMMNWEQMREIKGPHVSFYNHSATHPHFPELNSEDIAYEVVKGQARLINELGVSKKFFAYPYGEATVESYQQILERGYIGFGQQSGAINATSDQGYLPRFAMGGIYGELDSFITKVNTKAFNLKQQFTNPIIANGKNPELTLEFRDNQSKHAQLALTCFASGTHVPVKWLDSSTVSIRAKSAPKGRRARYNCTRMVESGVYQWYSMQWVNPSMPEFTDF